jgi:hypothetical protein
LAEEWATPVERLQGHTAAAFLENGPRVRPSAQRHFDRPGGSRGLESHSMPNIRGNLGRLMGYGRGCAEGAELGGRRAAQYLRLGRSRVNSCALTVSLSDSFRESKRCLTPTEYGNSPLTKTLHKYLFNHATACALASSAAAVSTSLLVFALTTKPCLQPL